MDVRSQISMVYHMYSVPSRSVHTFLQATLHV